MSDLEYDIVDELYFLTTYSMLKNNLKMSDNDLFLGLNSLIQSQFVQYFIEMDGESNPNIAFNIETMQKLLFLASKKGLFAHNSR